MIHFSIVIPVYNAHKFLDNCVESVRNQTFEDFELILVNDGSTDGSGELCDRWAQKDERIRVIHQPNSGAASARNAAIKVAEGTYLAFLDSDDWWNSNQLLDVCCRRMEQTDADVLCFNFQKEYQGDLSNPYFSAPTAPAEMTSDQSFRYITEHDLWISSPCNKMIRRTLVEQNRLFFREGITAEDIDWCLRLALVAHRFDYVDINGFVYRQHGASASHQLSVASVKQLLENTRVCTGFLRDFQENVPEKANKLQSYVAYQYGTLLYAIAGLGNSPDKKTIMKEANQFRYLLSKSKNRKIRMLYMSDRLIGLWGTVSLLKIMRMGK